MVVRLPAGQRLKANPLAGCDADLRLIHEKESGIFLRYGFAHLFNNAQGADFARQDLPGEKFQPIFSIELGLLQRVAGRFDQL